MGTSFGCNDFWYHLVGYDWSMVFMVTFNLLTQEDKTRFCSRADPFYEEASKAVYLAKQAFWMECSRSSAW